MTTEMFIVLFTFGSGISALLTEALKKSFKNVSSNIVALVDAVCVGACGTIIYYIMNDVKFTAQNICWIILMSFAIWLGSMVSYDKVLQTISQVKGE